MSYCTSERLSLQQTAVNIAQEITTARQKNFSIEKIKELENKLEDIMNLLICLGDCSD